MRAKCSPPPRCKRLIGVICGSIILALGGCDAAMPELFAGGLDCASTEAQNLVIEIIKENDNRLARSAWSNGYFEKNSKEDFFKSQADRVNNARYNLKNIILVSRDQVTGSLECKADISAVIANWGEASAWVKYTLEKTTDGSLSVTVHR